ncbi:MAG: hypothetical protein J6D31_06475 [Clostridia bacterium]|nr:hypothetical protein [Clostridia bacterium]
MATWIWKYRDFEFYHGMQYMLAREDRGNFVPAFYKIPRHSASVRFSKRVDLAEAEEITLTSEGECALELDWIRLAYAERYLIPAGQHQIRISVGNATGMCALWIDGKTIESDESWSVEAYDNDFAPVASSPLCNDRNQKPGDFRFPEEVCIPASDVTKNGERIIDFGRETFVRLHVTGVTGEVCVFYGECLEETYSDRCVIIDRFHGDGELPLRACRYLRFTGATDFNLQATMPILPPLRASFDGDAQMNKIYETSAYTLGLCSRLFYLDGIKRDRWPWAGDAYITMHMDAYGYADPDIMRRTMLVLRGESPVRQPVNNILEYSFYWHMMLGAYYTYTGDADFIRRNYENARSLIEYYIEKRDQYGFVPPIPGVWLFVDWHPMDKNGDVCVVQMLFYRSLTVMAELATLCERQADAARYRQMAEELAAAINATYWREELGAYVSVFRNGEAVSEVRRHQNYLAILFGLADEGRTQRIMETVLHNPQIPPITTPFYKFFEYDVLCRCGFVAEAFAEMRRYYGGMLALGATAIWEDFNEREEGLAHYAMYGEPFDRSLCHAWGAGPLYFTGRYLAGVQPAAPGWQQFTVAPCLDLGDFSATVPVGTGSVTVTLSGNQLTVLADRDGGCLTVGDACHPLSAGQALSLTI